MQFARRYYGFDAQTKGELNALFGERYSFFEATEAVLLAKKDKGETTIKRIYARYPDTKSSMTYA